MEIASEYGTFLGAPYCDVYNKNSRDSLPTDPLNEIVSRKSNIQSHLPQSIEQSQKLPSTNFDNKLAFVGLRGSVDTNINDTRSRKP